MYASLLITTVALPLSAGFIMISVRALSFCNASRSSVVKLSFPGLKLLVCCQMSRRIVLMYASEGASLFFGGVHLLFSLNLGRCWFWFIVSSSGS